MERLLSRGRMSTMFRLLGSLILAQKSKGFWPSDTGPPLAPSGLYLTPTHHLLLLPIGEKWAPRSVFRADLRPGSLA